MATDVALFKTTLLARRFPGLKDMKEEDIRALMAADEKATGRTLQDPRSNRTCPKTQYFIPPHKRDTTPVSTQPVFSPINPHTAKETIRRPYSEGHLGEGNPYDLDTRCFLADKHVDEDKRTAAWHPTCPAEAKNTIHIDYYLNSADAEGKQHERELTHNRASAGMTALKELTTARRGQMIV